MAHSRLLTSTTPIPHGASTTLVVVLHGLGRDTEDWCHALREVLSDADVMVPQYRADILSNVDPRRVADQLVEYIHEADQARTQQADGGQYDRIILIGYSIGGLIIRKTYLIAMGYGDDETLVHKAKPMPWATKVERIVLMAAVNRGLSTLKPKGTSWGLYALQQMGWATIPRLGLGQLLSQMRRGSPFVANLRVQWIRLSQSAEVQLPPTIQLLGDLDDVVSEEDNIDVLANANFRYIKLRDTGHTSICNFQDAEVGAYRRAKFLQAVTTPIAQLEGDGVVNGQEVGQGIDHVVFIMHGIRDMGLWTIRVSEALETAAQQTGQSVETITAGYGYFPMLRFLFFGARQVNVRWFMDRYTEALARYPQAKISYVGHSNGTYLLASALERYRACRIHHVAFAGSVVPKQYPWDRLRAEGRVQAVRNDIASADWIVGVFPGLFELLHWADLGTAGHNGFQDDTPKESSFDRYFQGGHGAALNAANHPSLARFILTGERMPPNQPILVDQQNGLTATLAKLCWLVWLLIIMVLGLIGFGITTGLIGLGISPTLAWGLYGVLVLLLMYTL